MTLTRTALMVGVILSVAARVDAGAPEAEIHHFIGSADHVRITGVEPIGDDGPEVIVTVIIDPDFHINANPASLQYLIPTTLNVTSETPLRITYPRPVSFKPKFAEGAIDVYQGKIQIIAEFPVSSGRARYLLGTLTVQACTDIICLPPADLPLPERR
jgi:hypothetical protein